MTVSKELSRRDNDMGRQIAHNGRTSHCLNNSSSNTIPHRGDADHDGKPDRSVHEELSEDTNRIKGK